MLRLSGMHLKIHSSLQYLSIYARLYFAKGMAAIPSITHKLSSSSSWAYITYRKPYMSKLCHQRQPGTPFQTWPLMQFFGCTNNSLQ